MMPASWFVIRLHRASPSGKGLIEGVEPTAFHLRFAPVDRASDTRHQRREGGDAMTQDPRVPQQGSPIHDPDYGTEPMQQQPHGGGHDFAAQAARFNREHIRTPETKEFFKSSEFLLLVLGIVALLFASALAPELDSGRVWTLLTVLGVGYMVSRGFSKAGTRRGEYADPTSYVARPAGYAPQAGYSGNDGGHNIGAFVDQHVRTPETKEFFKTSEFALWALGVIAVLLAAAVAADVLDAIKAWTLITALSSGYIISRGLAKAGTHRADDWPANAGANQGGGNDLSAALSRAAHFVRTPETKEFFKTSEFMVWGLTVLALLLASAIVDIFDAQHAWDRITAVTVAYIVSRGLSKIGTRRDMDTDRRSRANRGALAGHQPAGYYAPSQAPAGAGAPYGDVSGRISQKQPVDVRDVQSAPGDAFPTGAGPQPGTPQPGPNQQL
jgi:hypothetical protein